jgi:hypothetical protein
MDGARIDRVFDFPADLAFLPSGELAIVGRTNGSARMADAHSGDLAGHWVSLVKPGSLERVESGRLYAGPMSRPSLRIHYKNAATGRPASSILSFPNEGQRAFVDTELRRPQPFQSAAEE